MSDENIIVSKEGLEQLKSELEERKNQIRKKIADEIDKARQQGDLSENSAYKSAIESNEFNENRIKILTDLITNAVVEENVNPDIISIGSKVLVKNLDNDQEIEFTIVGEREADPSLRKISIISPIGSALKGNKKGDRVVVELPNNQVNFEIIAVN
jgi:transcription elongation factor GreA